MRTCLVFTLCVLHSAFGTSSARAQDKVTYQDHVLPVFRNACLNCHNPDKKKADLDLSTYSGVMSGGGSGKAIEPGDADASLLYKLVTHAQEPNMPPKGDKLPAKDLDLIKRWIVGGVLESSASGAIVSNKPKVDLKVVAAPGKPDGPPPMPGDLLLEAPVHTTRAGAVLAMASSPWAPLVAVGGQKQVLLYNPKTRELLGVLPFPEGFPNVLKFSRSGKLLLVAGGVGAKSGKAVLFDVATGNRVTEVGDELDSVLAADISPDQSTVALGGSSKVVKLYSTANGSLTASIKKHTDWVTAISFSPDGVLLASGDRNGGLIVWEADSAAEFYTLPGHKAAVTRTCFRADSNLLATSGEDGDVKLWDMTSGKQAKVIKAHANGALSVDFAPDGRLVTAGRDNRVRSWKPDGNQIKSYKDFADIALHAVFDNSDGGKRVVAADWTGAVRVFDVDDAKTLGPLDANPPAIAERISLATAKLPELQGIADNLARAMARDRAKLDEASSAKQKIESSLASLQKSIEEAKSKSPAAAEAQKKAAAAYETARADVQSKQSESDKLLQASLGAEAAQDAAASEHDALAAEVMTKQTASSAASEAAAKAKAAAEASPKDEALAKAAEEAGEKSDKAADALADAQKALGAKSDQLEKLSEATVKALTQATDAAEAANDARQSAEAARKAGEQAAADVIAANKSLAESTQAKSVAQKDLPKAVENFASANAAVEKLKPSVDEAAGNVNEVKQQIARLQAGQFFTQVYAARQEVLVRQRESNVADAEAKAAQTASEKAVADVPAFEKRIVEFPRTIAAAERALPLAQQTAGAAANIAKAFVELAGQREAFVKESSDHAAEVSELATKNASNKLLADAAAAAKASAELLSAELEKVRESLKSQQAAAKSAEDAFTAAKAHLESEQLAQKNSATTLESLKAAIPTVQALAAQKKSLAESAGKNLGDAKAKSEQLDAQYAGLKKQLGLASAG